MKSQKMFPGLGAFVVIMLYGDEWVAYRGAATFEKARVYRRELPQWPMDKLAIVANMEGRWQLDNDGKRKFELATCGHCHKSWNDAFITGVTPTPSARCPFEYDH